MAGPAAASPVTKPGGRRAGRPRRTTSRPTCPTATPRAARPVVGRPGQQPDRAVHAGRQLAADDRSSGGGHGSDASHPGATLRHGCGGGRDHHPDPHPRRQTTGPLRLRPGVPCRVDVQPRGGFVGELDWSGWKRHGFTPIPRGLARSRRRDLRRGAQQPLGRVFDNAGKSAQVPRQADMNDPRGLDIDHRNGDVVVVGAYTTTSSGSRGEPRAAAAQEAPSTASPAAAQFDAIRFPAVDGDGNVYVGETWGNRQVDGSYSGHTVYKFDPAGRRLPWASPPAGPPDGGFNQPNGVALDAAGRLFVVDTFEQRVQRFAAAGSCLPRRRAGPGSCSSAPGSRPVPVPGFRLSPGPRPTAASATSSTSATTTTRCSPGPPEAASCTGSARPASGAGQFPAGSRAWRPRAGGSTPRTRQLPAVGLGRGREPGPGQRHRDPVTSMGGCGSTAGQMAAPRGIAVGDAAGDPGPSTWRSPATTASPAGTSRRRLRRSCGPCAPERRC